MKKGNLKNWNLDGSEESLLFFAQRMNELLFDYTLDSFKYYALNISLLISESLTRLSKLKEEVDTDKNLGNIIDEINLIAQDDIITHSILGSHYSIFFPIKVGKDKEQLKTKLKLLSNRLDLNVVVKELINLIPQVIEKKEKVKINVLSNILVTSLINVGFHQSYIYHMTNNVFFSGKLKKHRTIENFFKLFSPQKTIYSVIVKVSDSFLEIEDICSKFKLELKKDYSDTSIKGKASSFIKSKKADQIFVISENIKAFDTQSARLIALNKLNTISKLFTYFHHKSPPKIDREAIVTTEGRHFLIEPATSPMTKGEDMSHKDAAFMLHEFLGRFDNRNIESRVRFNRAMNLHSQALTTTSNENRILNLWICYETLFGGGQTTTVIHIINSLSHISSLKYFYRIFNELSKSIKTWNNKELEKIKELTGYDSDRKAVCVFCLSDEFKEQRIEFYGKLNEFPLLRFRIFDINKKLGTADRVLKYLNQHNQRIKWHIKRLYRTRNQIVHDGNRPANLEILVENAHSYFDIFMDEYIIDNMYAGSVKTIDQAVANYKLLNDSWINILKEKKEEKIVLSNFEQLLLFKEYGH